MRCAIAGLAAMIDAKELIVARKPGSPQMPKTPAIDHDAIRDLAKLLDETGLTEIELQARRRGRSAWRGT